MVCSLYLLVSNIGVSENQKKFLYVVRGKSESFLIDLVRNDSKS